jgi:hypothetical protein
MMAALTLSATGLVISVGALALLGLAASALFGGKNDLQPSLLASARAMSHKGME